MVKVPLANKGFIEVNYDQYPVAIYQTPNSFLQEACPVEND